MTVEREKTGQEGQPKSLFDVLVRTTVSEFASRDSFIEKGGNKTGYTLWFAAEDAVKEVLKTGRTSLEIFKELAEKSEVRPTDIKNLRVLSELNPNNWNELLNIASELILEKWVAGIFPDLAVESDIRYHHYA